MRAKGVVRPVTQGLQQDTWQADDRQELLANSMLDCARLLLFVIINTPHIYRVVISSATCLYSS